MKKSALALILAVLMAVGLLTIGAAADDVGTECTEKDCDHVAAIGDKHYESLADAVEAAGSNETTIMLLRNANGNGVKVPEESKITFDLNGFTYTIDGETVGSSGTETNGFQLLKDSTITFKNGTITSTKAKLLIQNYSNLTLDNVKLDGSKLASSSSGNYTLSNNCGNVVISDSTIIAKEGQFAFDVYYWPKNGYTEGVNVTVEGNSVITGKIEYGSDGTEADVAEKASLNITGGTFTGALNVGKLGTSSETGINVTGGKFEAADGGTWDDYIQPGMKLDEDGKVVIDTDTAVASIGTVGYDTLSAALGAAKTGQTVKVLKDTIFSTDTYTFNSGEKITLDLGGHTITDGRLNLLSGNITIQNGNIIPETTTQPLNVYGDDDVNGNKSWLTIGDDVVIEAEYGICVFPEISSGNKYGYNAVVNVYGEVYGGIFVSGNIGGKEEVNEEMRGHPDNLPAVNVYKGAIVSGNTTGQGIALNGLAVVNIKGGLVEGTEAVGVKSGILNVTGGTLVANGEAKDPAEANNNGTEDTGAAISITGTYSKYGEINVNISDGFITSQKGNALYLGHSRNNDGTDVVYGHEVTVEITGGEFEGERGAVYIAKPIQGDAEYSQKPISGGSFSSSVAEYVTDDFKFELDNNGTFSYYETAEEALDYAEPGAVIKGIGDQADVNVYSLKVVYGNGQPDYSVKEVPYGTKYTLPTVSKPGYIFMGWKCSDEHTHQAGETVTITGNVTFTAIWANMPDITPGTPDDDDEPVVPDFPFTDVREGQWFYEAVKYVYTEGIMNGMDRYTFDPNGSLTRAMVWTMLARHEGVDTENGANWYAKAQEWAVEAGVSDGTDPMGNITREQLVTMLWRLNGSETVTGSLTGFTDYDKVSDWAGNAMLWATVNGIIEGDEANALNPTAGCTRAQAAAMIMRFCAYHEADSFGTVV